MNLSSIRIIEPSKVSKPVVPIRSEWSKLVRKMKVGQSVILKSRYQENSFRMAARYSKMYVSARRVKSGYRCWLLQSKPVQTNWDIDINNLPIPQSAYSFLAGR